MTKLIKPLSFSSSIYYDVASIIENTDLKNFGDEASLTAAGSKRSALSASDAECFSLCLGAGPLWCGPDVPAHGSAPPGGVNVGAFSGPASPAHDDNGDLLTSLLWGSARSLSSSAETLVSPAEAHPVFHGALREEVINKILERKDQQPVKVDFKIFLTENTCNNWEAVVHGSTIYLRLPGVLSSGSKESFMVLLDFAEEKLGCTNCMVCVRKSRADRAAVLRTFMFLGFQLLQPTSPMLPCELNNPDYVFLNYNMQ